jgi:outer membrane protein assembly factor BamB
VSPAEEEESPESFLVAIDAEDQRERWRLGLEATSRTGVAIDGDTAYVGDDAGNVYAVAVEDGTLRWSVNAGDADGPCPATDAGHVDVPLTVADGRVIAIARETDQGSVLVTAYAVADGACAWRRAPQVGLTSTSSAAAGGGLVVVGLPDRYVRGLDGETGEPRWSSLALHTFWPSSAPVLRSDGVVVADAQGGLYRIDPSDGSRAWGFQFNEFSFRSSPVVSGGAVLLGLDDGRLVAVDADSGHLVWASEATPGPIGTIALTGDVVVATKGGPDAGLIAFEPDPHGTLVDVASPTDLEPGTTLVRIAAAAALVLAVVLVPGLLLRRRIDVRIEQDDGDEDGEEGS